MQTFSPMQLIICKCKGNGCWGDSVSLSSLLSVCFPAGATRSGQFDQALYLAWTLGTGKKQIANQQEGLWGMTVFTSHPGLTGTVLVPGNRRAQALPLNAAGSHSSSFCLVDSSQVRLRLPGFGASTPVHTASIRT